jgi:hypothetical protein
MHEKLRKDHRMISLIYNKKKIQVDASTSTDMLAAGGAWEDTVVATVVKPAPLNSVQDGHSMRTARKASDPIIIEFATSE